VVHTQLSTARDLLKRMALSPNLV